MAKKIVRVVGHKNPDTDSICAAIGMGDDEDTQRSHSSGCQ